MKNCRCPEGPEPGWPGTKSECRLMGVQSVQSLGGQRQNGHSAWPESVLVGGQSGQSLGGQSLGGQS